MRSLGLGPHRVEIGGRRRDPQLDRPFAQLSLGRHGGFVGRPDGELVPDQLAQQKGPEPPLLVRNPGP
jgi:hypothetical protein